MDYDEFAEGYSLSQDVVDVWAGAGEPISIEAAGGPRLGSFSAMVPSPQNLSGVVVGEQNQLNRAGTTITWDAAQGGYVSVRIQTGERIVLCRSPDDGQIEIPAEAFNHLSADAQRAGVRVSRFVTQTVLSEEPVAAVTIMLERRWIPSGLDGSQLRFGQ